MCLYYRLVENVLKGISLNLQDLCMLVSFRDEIERDFEFIGRMNHRWIYGWTYVDVIEKCGWDRVVYDIAIIVGDVNYLQTTREGCKNSLFGINMNNDFVLKRCIDFGAYNTFFALCQKTYDILATDQDKTRYDKFSATECLLRNENYKDKREPLDIAFNDMCPRDDKMAILLRSFKLDFANNPRKLIDLVKVRWFYLRHSKLTDPLEYEVFDFLIPQGMMEWRTNPGPFGAMIVQNPSLKLYQLLQKHNYSVSDSLFKEYDFRSGPIQVYYRLFGLGILSEEQLFQVSQDAIRKNPRIVLSHPVTPISKFSKDFLFDLLSCPVTSFAVFKAVYQALINANLDVYNGSLFCSIFDKKSQRFREEQGREKRLLMILQRIVNFDDRFNFPGLLSEMRNKREHPRFIRQVVEIQRSRR